MNTSTMIDIPIRRVAKAWGESRGESRAKINHVDKTVGFRI